MRRKKLLSIGVIALAAAIGVPSFALHRGDLGAFRNGSSASAASLGSRNFSDEEQKAWNDVGVVKTADAATVYQKASDKSEKTGRLYDGAGAKVIQKGKGWTKISSGKVSGYIRNNYLLSGKSGYKYAISLHSVNMMTKQDTQVHASPDASSKVIKKVQKSTVLSPGEDRQITVVTPTWSDHTTDSKWLEVDLGTEHGYVSAADVQTGLDMETGVSMKEDRQVSKILDAAREESLKQEEKKLGVVYSVGLTDKAAADTYSYMGWRKITSKGTPQYKLLSGYEEYDADGFGKVDGRYVIATTPYFGKIGDRVDFKLANGRVIRAIIGDHKNMSDPGCNLYGHKDGHIVVEFVVNQKMWYGTDKTPVKYHPEWDSRAVESVNYGNIWDAADKSLSQKRTEAQERLAKVHDLKDREDAETAAKKAEKKKKAAEKKKKAAEKKKKAAEKKKKAEEKKKKASEKKAKEQKQKKAEAAQAKRAEQKKARERAKAREEAREKAARQERIREQRQRRQRIERQQAAERRQKAREEQRQKEREQERRAAEQKQKEKSHRAHSNKSGQSDSQQTKDSGESEEGTQSE